MPNKTKKVLSLALTILLPGTLLAAPNQVSAAGIISSSGEVEVNNHLVSHSRAVFVGDYLRTGDVAAARVTMNGSALTVNQHSTAVFGANMITLGCGSIEALTNSKFGTIVGGVSVVPSSAAARYSVSTGAGGLRIVALAGSLIANDGKSQRVIESGKEIVLAANTGCAVTNPDDMKAGGADDKDKNKKKKGGYKWDYVGLIVPAAIGVGIAIDVLNRPGILPGPALSQTLP